jgi:hypothetical protein
VWYRVEGGRSAVVATVGGEGISVRVRRLACTPHSSRIHHKRSCWNAVRPRGRR